jgi:hypothetical protein
MKEIYEAKYWYILTRGLIYFKTGEYSKAYGFLLNGMKRLDSLSREASQRSGAIRSTAKKGLVTLTKLKSGRLDSKCIFSMDYINKNCPTIYFEELSESVQQDILLNIRYILAVCNKFLQKPYPSISMHLDILAILSSQDDIELLPTQNRPDLAKIIEIIGLNLVTDAARAKYEDAKLKLSNHLLNKLSIGELATLYLYNENVYESLYYAMLYSNYQDVSLSILMELIIKALDLMNDHQKLITKKAVEDLVDHAFDKFQAKYEECKDNLLQLEVVQQIAFLGSFLEYKAKRDPKSTKFLYKLLNYDKILEHTSQTDNNVLTYNLGIFNEQVEKPLCAYFSLNYSSWIQYYLKSADLIPPAEGLAAILISLNLNFDNQLCWNLLARYMLSHEYFKFSLQA